MMRKIKLIYAVYLFVALFLVSCSSDSMQLSNIERKKVIVITPVSHPSLEQSILGFIDGLSSEGYDNDKIGIKKMNANGDFSRVPSLTKNAVEEQPDLIFVLTTPAASQAIKITDPAGVNLIYTAVTDPIKAGIVTGMEKSNTLATGVSDRYPVKEQVKLFKLIYPEMKMAAVLYNPDEENSRILQLQTISELENNDVGYREFKINEQSKIVGLTKQALNVSDCLIVNGDNMLVENISLIINLCKKAKKPIFVGDPESVRRGAVATVGPSYYSIGEKAGKKAAKVLKGESPKDIPSEYPNSFDYIVNTSAAYDMGLNIPRRFWQSRTIWESNSTTNIK